jgi:hypothetical protein
MNLNTISLPSLVGKANKRSPMAKCFTEHKIKTCAPKKILHDTQLVKGVCPQLFFFFFLFFGGKKEPFHWPITNIASCHLFIYLLTSQVAPWVGSSSYGKLCECGWWVCPACPWVSASTLTPPKPAPICATMDGIPHFHSFVAGWTNITWIEYLCDITLHLGNLHIDGWMDRWMDGWIDGWMDRWMDGWIDGWMDEWNPIMI